MIRKLNRHERPELIAEMIYESDHLFMSAFGNKGESIRYISKIMEMENSEYSYRNVYVYDDGDIVAMLVGVPLDKTDPRSSGKDYRAAIPFLKRVRVTFRMIMISGLFIKENDGVYIPNLCVSEERRGQGIGTELLRGYCRLAKEEGYSKVYLEASMDNPKAKSLYEREGFECFDVKKQRFGKEGMYHMRKML